jgi:SAM-dependent methyltransferase
MAVFPTIEEELKDVIDQGLLVGKVLNAGCGWRNIDHLVTGEMTNQDLRYDDESRTNVHIYSPLEEIPRPDGYFDAVLCNAVLEHVIDPIKVVSELARVTRPGGHLIVSVPFLQPEHKVPTDYQRYTEDGLVTLVTNAGFTVTQIKPLFNVYTTLYWMVQEWIRLLPPIPQALLRHSVLHLLGMIASRSTLTSPVLASAFQVIARKN